MLNHWRNSCGSSGLHQNSVNTARGTPTHQRASKVSPARQPPIASSYAFRNALPRESFSEIFLFRYFVPSTNVFRTSVERGGSQTVRVRLVGGPRHGDWTVAQPGQIVTIEIPRPPDSPDSMRWIADYTPTEDDLSVYTFNGIESKPLPEYQMPKFPRAFEIAKEFGIESKAVMVKLQEMGEFVRSASSTVQPRCARQIVGTLPS